MRKLTAVAGSVVFLVVAPGVVAGLVPWWLTGWHVGSSWPVLVRVAGVVMIAAIAMTFNELVRWVETRCSHWRT